MMRRMVGSSDALTDQWIRIARERERVVSVDDVKATTLKETKNKNENKIHIYCLWR